MSTHSDVIWFRASPGGAAEQHILAWIQARQKAHTFWAKVAGYTPIECPHIHLSGRHFHSWGIPPRKIRTTQKAFRPYIKDPIWEQIRSVEAPTPYDLLCDLIGRPRNEKGFAPTLGFEHAGKGLFRGRVESMGFQKIGEVFFIEISMESPPEIEGAERIRYSDVVRAQEDAEAARDLETQPDA